MKLSKILRSRWYNPDQNKIIMAVVKNCTPCQYSNLSYAKKEGEKIVGYSKPRICHYVDLSGLYQINLSRDDNRYILLMVDVIAENSLLVYYILL